MRDLNISVLLSLAMIFTGAAAFAQHEGPAMNFLRIDDRLATGGHLTDDGLGELKAQGVKVIIDLRDEPPAGQRERLEAAGIEWINVPVVWSSPRESDFAAFKAAMSEHQDDSILVQCQANYRASAMTYLYRVLVDGVAEPEARKAMNEIWEPSGTWREFIDGLLD